MIDELQVNNIALIEEAVLRPSRGLTVLTGETGTGKTALISACKLLMGMRADSSMVRDGSSGAEVQGRLFLKNPEVSEEDPDSTLPGDLLASQDQATAESEYVVSRRIGTDGRSRATINGKMASVSELASQVGPSIELCGQHDQQKLMKPREHGRLLDRWAHLTEEAQPAYRAAYQEREAARRQLDEIKLQAEASQSELDEARFTAAQIAAVNPYGGEYEEIRDFLSKAEHAESLARSTHGASEALSGDGGTLDTLNSAITLLEEAARIDGKLQAYAQSLKETCFVVEDVARDMVSYYEDIDFDGSALIAAQERMSTLQGLMRTYGPTMDQVLDRWEQAENTIELADRGDEHIVEAQKALDQANEKLQIAVDAYLQARLQAAPQFAAEVNAVMEQLDMGNASLVCTVDPLESERWDSFEPCSVTLEFKPGSHMQTRPLARIASGGEMSRVMLAIKAVLGEQDGTDTLIFDEVDAGVGGATAHALAQVLAQLAHNHQVIVITHLAQIAVAADTHYVVRKSDGAAPVTSLHLLEEEGREHEVARMLSGDATETSLAHARELLSAATS